VFECGIEMTEKSPSCWCIHIISLHVHCYLMQTTVLALHQRQERQLAAMLAGLRAESCIEAARQQAGLAQLGFLPGAAAT
jgi:hypothetical protein